MGKTPDSRVADIVIESLRGGEVPQEGLEHFATGIEAQVRALEAELDRIADQRGRVRFLRGEFGAGKTFFLKHLHARARAEGFASAYVRVSYPEVPLHNPVAIYRALADGLGVGERTGGALRHVLDHWLYVVSERVMDPQLGRGLEPDVPGFADAMDAEIKSMLGAVADAAPAFAQALAGYARASLAGDNDLARALLQFLAGDPKVASSAKRTAHLVGKLDATDILPMVRGLATVIVQARYRGLVILVDEVERLVRLPRAESRKAGLELLQNWMGALDGGQLPYTLLVVAGTTTFYDSPRGVPMLEPLQQRIGLLDDGPFPDMDAVQIRLPSFDRKRLVDVGRKVRELYEIRWPGTAERCDDAFLDRLAADVAGAFGGKVETTPRRYLRELIGVLGRIKQYPTFDPATAYKFRLEEHGAPALEPAERAAVEGRAATEAEAEPIAEFDL